jgi:uncharacterized protein YqfB (UPF0267 family)
MITATELLNLLYKAQTVSGVGVTFRQNDEGYYITLYCDWHDDSNYSKQTVFINNENESNWEKGDYDFDTMNNILEELVEREKQKEIKAQKRKELIESLTPEQRELLGV